MTNRILLSTIIFALLSACRPQPGASTGAAPRPRGLITCAADVCPSLREMTKGLRAEWLVLPPSSAELDEAARTSAVTIRVLADLPCKECYRIDQLTDAIVVHGDAPLGVQYGLAHTLEILGYRFYSPFRTYEPRSLDAAAAAATIAELGGKTFEPEMKIRGLHLHTLHPIESLFAFWLPSEEDLADAMKILDWTIKNRGNYVQWVALNDINDSDAQYNAWRQHSSAIATAAHARGLRIGVNVLQFGASSLQNAYVLQKKAGSSAEVQAEIQSAVKKILTVPFDAINLSFGEFIGSDPQAFVDSVSTAVDAIHAVEADLDVSGTIHVGNFPNLYVNYKGETLQYYFLVKYVDKLIPWVHSVMYFNLFDPAGGAYKHTEFDQHRDFLLQRLRERKRVAYQPETAYWISFDNSVPQYLPLYMESRWIDVDRIKKAAQKQGSPSLEEHITFTSGWEWGYWQHDYATLRMNYNVPTDWRDTVREMFGQYEEGNPAETVIQLAELQHEYLIEKKLAAYIAGRDLYIDLGRIINIVSQPDRILLEDLEAMDAQGRQQFFGHQLQTIQAYEQALVPLAAQASQLPAADPFLAEIRDGIQIDYWRARFVDSTYAAGLAFLGKNDPGVHVRAAEAALREAEKIVARRDLHLNYKTVDVTDNNRNPTIYQFGYLKQASTLCLWHRELQKLRQLMGDKEAAAPSCII